MMGNKWTLQQMPSQKGSTVVITGANSGIGYETAKAFAAKGAEVVFAVRNLAKGEEAARRIKQEHPDAALKLMRLDLGDLASVRQFADEYREAYDSLNLLINNAGVMTPPYRKTKDGFELQFGSNHLGHFALTGLLLPMMSQVPSSRVVTLSSSVINSNPRIEFDNLDGSKGYNRVKFYGQSKLANLLFAQELDKRLKASGAKTISLSSHPGRADTNLYSLGSGKQAGPFMKILKLMIGTQSAAMGALPSAYAATHPELKGGEYIGPDGKGGNKGFPEVDRSAFKRYDSAIADRLWKVSESLTGVSYLSR